ncbi:MAG: hypothetical protein Kow0059_20800 [Candidatus Sumerlaeia bacterium]
MSDRPLNILYVLNRLSVGGMEKRVAALAIRLRREGWRTGMLCLTEGGEMEPALREAGVEIFILGYRGLRAAGPLGLLRAVRGGRRAVRAFGADAVQAFLPMGNILGALMTGGRRSEARGRRGSGQPCLIAGKVTSGFYYRRGRLYGVLENWALRRAALVVVNAGAIAEEIIRVNGVPRDRLRVIHNGVQVSPPPAPGERAARRAHWRARLGLAPESFLIGTVANLYAYKGHRFLIEAARGAAVRFPDVHLVFAGRDEGEAEALRRRAAALGLDGRVHLPGPVADVRDFLLALDALVSPSLVEGFSNVWLEAMAAALPCVFTRVGGAGEAFRDGEECLLVPPGDSAALAAALERLLTDAALRERLGAQAWAAVRERFSFDRMVEDYKRMYRETLGEG